MDENEKVTTKLEVDVTDFKQGLSDANRAIRLANSEFEKATAGVGKWSDSADGLKAKLTQLNKTLDAQEAAAAVLRKEYERVAAEQGENSKGAQELAIKLNKQEAACKKTAAQIEQYEAALEEMGDEADDAAEAVEDTGDAAEKSGDGFTVAKGALAGFIANGLSALVGAAKNAIGSLFDLAESTRDYRTELAKLETAATVAGASTDYIKGKWQDMSAVLGDEGAVTEGLNNLMAAGFTTEQEMDAITQHLEGAAIKWKDTLKFEGLADGLQETLATGKSVGAFSEMLERSGVNLEEFDEGLAKCKTSAEKQDYVLQQLSKLGLSEVSEAYREQNADLIEVNKKNSELADKQAELGKTMEPLVQKFNELKTKALSWLIETGLPAIKSGFEWVKNNIPTIVGLLGVLTAAWLTFGGAQKLVDTWNKIVAISQKALNAVMKANPIGLVVTAIMALIAAFVHLWDNSEAFRKFWINLWETIKAAAKAVVDWFVVAFEAVADFFRKFGENVKKIFRGAWNGVKAAWSGVTNFFGNVWSGIEKAFSKTVSWFKDIFSKAWQGIKNVFAPVGDFFGGIWDTIKEKFSTIGTKVAEAIGGAFKSAINAVIATVEGAINLIPNAINGAIHLINKLPGVEIGKIPTVSLPRLARGGVLKKGQVGLLEGDGAEAVVPLDQNRKWIRAVAQEFRRQAYAAGAGLTGAAGGIQAAGGATYNYYQYNYSPKALSRAEIYRQTKNQLHFAAANA